MSKPAAKGQVLSKKSPSDRLDDRISELTTKTVKGVKQYRIVFISLIGLVVVIGVAIHGLGEYRLHRERTLVARAYELFAAAAPTVSDPTVSDPTVSDPTVSLFPKVRQLVADAQGADCERQIVKEAFAFLLDRAQEEPAGEKPGEESAARPSISPAYLDEAKSLVELSKGRFVDDADFQSWSESSVRVVDSLYRLLNEEREKRAFQPLLPPGDAPDSPPGKAETSAIDAPSSQGILVQPTTSANAPSEPAPSDTADSPDSADSGPSAEKATQPGDE